MNFYRTRHLAKENACPLTLLSHRNDQRPGQEKPTLLGLISANCNVAAFEPQRRPRCVQKETLTPYSSFESSERSVRYRPRLVSFYRLYCKQVQLTKVQSPAGIRSLPKWPVQESSNAMQQSKATRHHRRIPNATQHSKASRHHGRISNSHSDVLPLEFDADFPSSSTVTKSTAK